MKNFLFFLGGMATMFLIEVLVVTIMHAQPYLGLTVFEERGACITRNNLRIFQTLGQDTALAEFGAFPNETLVFLTNANGEVYYDDKKIIVPKGKCAKQFGVYQYTTKQGVQKTVPAVIIE